MYLLGVDTGGTKSRCIVVDESFTLLGIGDAGPGNYRVAGTDGAKENVEAAIEDALTDAGIDRTEAFIGGFGMGTLDTDEDYRIISGFLEEIDLIDELYIENDVVAAYYSLTGGDPGVVVIGGTGAMGFGRNGAGERARSSGWGWLFGDEGSGFYAAREGLAAASQAYDGRGPDTELLPVAEEFFDLDTFDDIFTDVLDTIDHAKDIAPFAKPVAETAEAGDSVAISIIDECADELARAGIAVINNLYLAPEPEIGCLGSFGTAPVVYSRFKATVESEFPDVNFVEPIQNPVVGAIAYVADERGDRMSRSELQALDVAIESHDS